MKEAGLVVKGGEECARREMEAKEELKIIVGANLKISISKERE